MSHNFIKKEYIPCDGSKKENLFKKQRNSGGSHGGEKTVGGDNEAEFGKPLIFHILITLTK